MTLKKMTLKGEGSREAFRVDEDPFEKQMLLANEASAQQLRASTTPRYVKSQALDQLEVWIKEKPIPDISNDKFSQEGIFHYCDGRLSGYTHVYNMSLGCRDSFMVALHLEEGYIESFSLVENSMTQMLSSVDKVSRLSHGLTPCL
jgi:hypothetical protein